MRRHRHHLRLSDPLSLVAAAVFAIPTGAIAGFEAGLLVFGLTGEDASNPFVLLTAVLACGAAFGWSLARASRPAEVVHRACKLGLLVTAFLPLVAVAVLLLVQNSPAHTEYGMGGLMIYALPFIAFGIAAILALFFWLAGRWAKRSIQLQRDRPGP
jgi:hypothetical protein